MNGENIMTFDKSDKMESNKDTKEYKTEDLIVYWTPSLCSHSAQCIHGLPEVFNTQKRPWINMEAACPEDIIKTIDKCPTDALKYKLTENSKVDPSKAQDSGSIDFNSEKSATVQIKVIKKGPFTIKGPVKLIDSDGNIIQESRKMVLCRCGLSKNQPFCDGAHSNMIE